MKKAMKKGGKAGKSGDDAADGLDLGAVADGDDAAEADAAEENGKKSAGKNGKRTAHEIRSDRYEELGRVLKAQGNYLAESIEER